MYQDELIPGFRKQIEELEATVANQRKRADTAETFICTMCSECDYEVNDGILIMQKRCCSLVPLECGKFKLRPGWIPVTERLPEDGETVLVYGSRGGIYTAWCNRRYKNVAWHKLNSKSHYCNPTHWMPLPEPPKEVE